MGNFAVRVFSSVQALELLGRASSTQVPRVLVIDSRDLESPDMLSLRERVNAVLPSTPALWLGKKPSFLCRYFLDTPFEPLDLVRIVEHIFAQSSPDVLKFKDIEVDTQSFAMTAAGDRVSLTKLELKLLRVFLGHVGKCLTRDQISKLVWSGTKVSSRTIDSQISRLRKRLCDTEVMIEGVYGDGYVLR